MERSPTQFENQEKQEKFLENLGVSFQPEEGKEKVMTEDIEEQLNFILKKGIKECQIQFRKIKDQKSVNEMVKKFRAEHPEIHLSFHLEIDDKIKEQLESVLPGEIVTVHQLDEKILASIIADNRGTIFAIENMEDMIPEDMLSFLSETENILVGEFDFTKEEVEKILGITLDINHTIASAKKRFGKENREKQIEAIGNWIDLLKEKIKCFHFFIPSLKDEYSEISFQEKIKIFQKIYNENKLGVPVFLETKRDLGTTNRAFELAKEVGKI